MHLDRRHTDDRGYLDEQFIKTRARIERPPLYRGGSASKKDGWFLPDPPLRVCVSDARSV